MVYDEKLATRVRRVIGPRPDVIEQQMFGGLAYLLGGKMICGVIKHDLLVRVGRDAYEAALDRRHTRPMTFTGRPMSGFVLVGPAGWRTDAAVAAWVDQATAFVATLPARSAKKPRAKRPRPRAKPKPRAARRA